VSLACACFALNDSRYPDSLLVDWVGFSLATTEEYQMSVQTQIRHYILENFLYTSDESKLGDSDSFLEHGIVDSTGILELLMFVEEAFGFEVDDEEVLPDNFDSVERLTRYVEQKKGNGVIRAG
jgi:acyl carrier protein